MTENSSSAEHKASCRIYRCGKQPEMYIYLRDDLTIYSLPKELTRRTGQLTEVMQLALDAERKLARVDVRHVIKALHAQGFFVQLPPDGDVNPMLNDAD